MKKIKEVNAARQGDVLVMACKAIPPDAVAEESNDGALVVALGESSGHRHQLLARGNKLFRRGPAMYLEIGARGGALEVTTDRGAPISPPRHEPVRLAPGEYRVVIQKEWSIEQEQRNVAD